MEAGEGASSGPDRSRWLSTELGARLASGIVLGIAALGATFAGGGLFAVFWLLAGVAVAAEWISVARVEPRLPIQIVSGAGLALLTVLYLTQARLETFAVIGAGAMLVGAALGRHSRDRLWSSAGFLYAAVISLVPPILRDRPDLGLPVLLWMFAVVWATDVAAYFTGRRFGGPKLWPRISPKKTWSGFAGGVTAGVLSGLLVHFVAEGLGWASPFSWLVVALVSGIVSIASQGGDLGESALKREFDVKDSSHLIPGHGGAMDRLDGFWAAAALLGAALLLERAV
jgi:phosphatidate cytidylyltransferase